MVATCRHCVHNVDMAQTKTGAQVVGRLAALLRVVSEAMPEGVTTSQAARRAGLARPTVHRLLEALAAEGFCDHDHHRGRWLLGPELYLMGVSAAERYDITDLARRHVAALADATEESAFFSALRGNEAVCLLRQDGAFPIRSFVLYEGKRFPLGVASAGLGILAFMPQEEVDHYLARTDLVATHGEDHSAEAIRDRIAQGRRLGYVTNPGLIVEGSWGMAAAVFDARGYPAWALSLTGVDWRFDETRRPELGRLLMQHAHDLSQELQRRGASQG